MKRHIICSLLFQWWTNDGKVKLKAKSANTERVLLPKNPVFYLLQYGLATFNEASFHMDHMTS